MKTILVLTDFSKKAENAALYALRLAERTCADILLFHLYEQMQAVNVPETGSWVADDFDVFKNESLRGLLRLKDELQTQSQSTYKPGISCFNDFGPDLASTIGELVEREKISLVVMGAKGDDTLTHLFYGSDAYGVLDNAGCPVLFIPPGCQYDRLHTMVFANDFKEDYIEAIQFLTQLARVDDSHIILTHLGPYDNSAYKCLELIKQTNPYARVSSRLLHLNNFGEQLVQFAESVNADLVVMIHHYGLSLEKFLTGSKSKKILNHKNVPLLVLPA
jgi:nucleotide-binding universal stress UspA family protein